MSIERFTPTFFVNREPELDLIREIVAPNSPLAVLQVVGDAGMGKTWLVEKVNADMEQLVADTTGAVPPNFLKIKIDFDVDIDHDTFSLNAIRFVRLIRDRILFITDGLRAQFYETTQIINRFTNPDRRELEPFFVQLTEAFSIEELNRFALHQLDLNFENEIGGRDLQDRIFKLIQHFKRRNQLDHLTTKLQEARDHLTWDIGEHIESSSQSERQHALTEITAVFTKALSQISTRFDHLLILLDTVEEAPPEILEYLEVYLFPALRAEASQAITFMFTEPLDRFTRMRGMRDILKPVKLDKLKDHEVRDYFLINRGLNITPAEIDGLLNANDALSDVRIPRIMSAKADAFEQEFDDYFDSV